MTEQTTEETKEPKVEATPVVQPEETLSKSDQLSALKQVFKFMSNYDRVPGNFTTTWSQCLDALALVHNSIASELEQSQKK